MSADYKKRMPLTAQAVVARSLQCRRDLQPFELEGLLAIEKTLELMAEHEDVLRELVRIAVAAPHVKNLLEIFPHIEAVAIKGPSDIVVDTVSDIDEAHA